MLTRRQAVLRAGLGLLVFASLPSLLLADSWGQRTDLGIAAVDCKSGQVLWEAWEQADMPSNLSKKDRAAVAPLLPGFKGKAELGQPVFPAALGADRVVDQLYDDEYCYCFVLSHGKPDAIGAEIARLAFNGEGERYCRFAIFGGTLYCLRNNHVEAYVGTMKEAPKDKKWEPAWKCELMADLPESKRGWFGFAPMEIHANADGVWTVIGPRIVQLTREGRVQARYTLNRLMWSWFDYHNGTPLTFGKELIYYRSAIQVIALDWKKKRELWRLPTTLAPNLTRLIELDDDVVVFQIGSHVPYPLKSALGFTDHPLQQLVPSSAKQRIAAARLLHSYGDGYQRKQLRQYLDRLRKSDDDPDAKQAAAVLEKLLSTWPRRRDAQRLYVACVKAILQAEVKDGNHDFASPASHRLLVWSLMQKPIGYSIVGDPRGRDSAVERPLVLDGKLAAQLADHCRHILTKGPEVEKPYAIDVLLSRTVGWDRLTTAELKNLFLSTDPAIWHSTAGSLAWNGRRDELIQWASERPVADHLDILQILAQIIPKEWSKSELDFGLACARRNPGAVADVLDKYIQDEIPVAFRAPIRSYLEKEIAKPAVSDKDDVEPIYLFAAVDVLDRWKNPDDDSLLLKYLKHPYDRIRGLVKEILERRGVKLPPDVESGRRGRHRLLRSAVLSDWVMSSVPENFL